MVRNFHFRSRSVTRSPCPGPLWKSSVLMGRISCAIFLTSPLVKGTGSGPRQIPKSPLLLRCNGRLLSGPPPGTGRKSAVSAVEQSQTLDGKQGGHGYHGHNPKASVRISPHRLTGPPGKGRRKVAVIGPEATPPEIKGNSGKNGGYKKAESQCHCIVRAVKRTKWRPPWSRGP
jgi:hypothetical protein